MTNDGVKQNPEKIMAVKDFATPKNQKEINSFLGLTDDFSKILRNLDFETEFIITQYYLNWTRFFNSLCVTYIE